MAKAKRDYARGLDGNRLPSVTEIIGKHLGWKAQGLYGYFYKRGKEGLAMNEHRDAAAKKGSCAHDIVAAHFDYDNHGDLTEWSNDELANARPNANRVIAEVERRKWTVLYVEEAINSESFAGTPDMVVRDSDGNVIIVDLKTSKGVYNETVIQLGAYAWLHRLRCARNDAATYADVVALTGAVIHAPYGADLAVRPVSTAALMAGEQAFRLLLQLHEIQGQIKMGDAS